MDIETAEALFHKTAKELLVTPASDSAFKDLESILRTSAQIITEHYRAETERNHNNIQDDLAEEELRVNAKRVKVDLVRSILDFCGKLLSLIGAILMGKIAYTNEAVKFVLPLSKGLLDTAKNLLSSITRR